MTKRGVRQTGATKKASSGKRLPAKKSVAAKTPDWIVREVSDLTEQKPDQSRANQLTAALTALDGGVEKWNRWRAGHPKVRPYLSGANLSWVRKNIDSLEEIDFSNTELEGADFEGVSLARANLSGANLKGANFIDAGLNEADLTRANLQWADFTEAHLGFATLDEANMTGANLSDAELWCASLQGTNLSKAILDRAEASGAHVMGANLSFARLLDADFSEADFSGADLSYATLVGTNLQKATLNGCNVYGISVWDVSLDGADQSRLLIGRDGESPVMVDDIDVAQFVHLLLDHRKLRKAIDAVAERGVLILGRFSHGGLEVLEALAATLRELNYLPIIFDFDRPASRNYTETIMTLAGLSRFVIADLSGPSVPQELHATVPHFKIPFVPILHAGTKSYSMFADMLEYPWVIQPIVKFKNQEHLKDITKTLIVAPAEKKHRSRQALLKKLFNPTT